MRIICAQCESGFDAPAYLNRKFCGHVCYWEYRRENRMLPPSQRGVVYSEERKARHSATMKKHAVRGTNHPLWKGDEVGYVALHEWVYQQLGQPSRCEHCGATEGTFEWANKSGKYKRDVADWLRLCKRCHFTYDAVGQKMWATRRTEANAA